MTMTSSSAPASAGSLPARRRAAFGGLLLAEWTKIRSVRSTMWTLGVFLVLMVGVGTLFAVLASAAHANLQGSSPLGLGIGGVLTGSICIITLGVLTTASEYGTGMVRTTMTACPSRTRVLLAKAVVFFGVAFVITTVSAAFVGLIQTSILKSNGLPRPTGAEWLKGTVGIGLYMALLGLLSLLVGSIIRHSAGAITTMIGLVLAPLVIAMFIFGSSLRDLQKFLLEYSIPSQLSVLYGESLDGSGPAGWDPLWIILCSTAVAFAGAWLLLEKRDV